MRPRFTSHLRRCAAAALLAGTALAAQARGQWSIGLDLGWPVYPLKGAAAAILPGAAVSVQFGGINYWHHRGVWYRPWGPRWVVVAAPLAIVVPIVAAPGEPAPAPAAPSRPEPVTYPRHGQDAQQTEADRQACDRWATTQPAALADAAVFQRAVEACMDGRGYTLK